MKKENLFLTTSLLVTLAMNVSAQDSLKKNQLKEVVVSDSRSERNIDEVGRSATIITSADIKKSGANSISELLSRQEGVYLIGTGQNPGMTSSIFMRGSNSNQTSILIDGVKITDPCAINNSIDLAELSLANIDRIEILRGSHSTMYGSSAIGGVVNIITKKAAKSGLTLDVMDTHGTFGAGTLAGFDNIYVGYALKNGLYISAEGYNENTKGLNATVDTITRASVYKHDNLTDNFNKWDANAKVGFINKKFPGRILVHVYSFSKESRLLIVHQFFL
jgi:vitamin B12 transporter